MAKGKKRRKQRKPKKSKKKAEPQAKPAVEAAPKAEAQPTGVEPTSMTCAVCEVLVPRGQARPCAACGANHHVKCWGDAEACGSCGEGAGGTVVEGPLVRALGAFRDEFKHTGPALILLSLLAIVVYVNALWVPFLFDDAPVITRNERLWEWGRAGDLVTWHPTRALTNLTFLVNFQLAHDGVPHRPFSMTDWWSYHVVSILMHALNGVLVYLLVRDLLKARPGEVPPGMLKMVALAGAALWVVHPGNTMAVSYIAQRYALMGAMAFLITLVLYVRLRLRMQVTGEDVWDRPWAFGLIVLAAISCLVTKPNAAVVPLGIIAVELFFFGGRRWRLASSFLGLFAIFGFMALLYFGWDGFIRRFFPGSSPTANSRTAYFITQTVVVLRYLHLFLLPHDLSGEEAFPVLWKSEVEVEGKDPVAGGWVNEWWLPTGSLGGFELDGAGGMVVLAVLGHLLLWGFATKLFLRGHRFIPLAIVWFYITNIVESSVVPILDPMVDHRMYLPTALLAPALAVAVARSWQPLTARWPQLRVAIPIVTMLAVVGLGVGTVRRNQTWTSAVGFWEDTLEKRPYCARAYSSLGMEYLYKAGRQEDPDQAKIYYHRSVTPIHLALELGPAHVEGWNNLGKAYLELGQLDRAEQALLQGIVVNRYHPSRSVMYCHNNVGLIYIRVARRLRTVEERKKLQLKAIYHLKEAVDPDKGNAFYKVAWLNMANAYFNLMNDAPAKSDERKEYAKGCVQAIDVADRISAIKKEPLLLQQRRWRAIAKGEAGDYAGAFADLEALLGGLNEQTAAWQVHLVNDYGELAARAHLLEQPDSKSWLKKAVAFLDPVIKQQPKNGLLRITRGMVADALMDRAGALRNLKEGMRLLKGRHRLAKGIRIRIAQLEKGE